MLVRQGVSFCMEKVQGCQQTGEVIREGWVVPYMEPTSCAREPLLQEGERAVGWDSQAMSKAKGGASQVPSRGDGTRRASKGGQVRKGAVVAPCPLGQGVGGELSGAGRGPPLLGSSIITSGLPSGFPRSA